MTSTTKCPKCGHTIDVTDQLNADVRLIADSLAAKVKQLEQSLVELHKLLTDAAVAFGNGTSADHDPPTPNPDGDYLIGCIRKSWLGDTLVAIHKEHVLAVIRSGEPKKEE